MSFQTFNLSSKYGASTSKPSSRVPLGVAGQVADHQPGWPLASVGQESADKENAPQHEYVVQPSRPIATNIRIQALNSASDNGGTITASAYCRVSPRKKAARPALLVPLSSPSPSSPTEPTTSRPRKLAGKRNSPSDDFAGPSSPPKKARRLEEKGDETSASSQSGLPSGSNSRPITRLPTHVSTRDIATSPQPSLADVRADTPEPVLSRDNQATISKLREQDIIEAKSTSHQSSPSSDSDRSNSRGGRENISAAAMARRISEVHKLEDQYVDLMEKLHGGDQTDGPLPDDDLEDNFAAANAAYKAWQDAKLRLSSPTSASPSTSTIPASTTSSPALNSVSGGYGDPSVVGLMRESCLVLLTHLDNVLPDIPVVVAANTSDGGVETTESADARDEEPTIPDTLPSPPPPSEDPQGEGVALPASLTPSSEPTFVGVQSGPPESEEVTPSASSVPPVPDTPSTSSSVASAASTAFRFSQGDEVLLLGHTRAKRWAKATDMLPQTQQARVITTPTEIAAVRLAHPKRTANPTNKGKSSTRETRSHIGEDGTETELWVCRASFKVDEGGVSYLAGPCGMPVGTKDSWKRHLREKHFGRESRK